MSNYLNLSDYDLSLIGSGLRLMMTENAKISMKGVKKDSKQHCESLSLELFTLSSKISVPNVGKYIELSIYELKLIKNALLLLAAFIYKKSLRKTEKTKTQYYDNCNLQLIKVRDKISRIESSKRSSAI